MNTAIGIIQARCSSTRLPGKVLMPLAKAPMIEHIYKRAMSCDLLSNVIVATSNDASDVPLVEFCKRKGIAVYAGSLNDVFSRYVEILSNCDADYFVRITGDCPFIQPSFIDYQIKILRSKAADFIRLEPHMALFDGQGVMSKQCLLNIAECDLSMEDREHVASFYIQKNLWKFEILSLEIKTALNVANISLAVDTAADYDLISYLYEKYYEHDKIVNLEDVVKFILQHKSILSALQNREQSTINESLSLKRENYSNPNWEKAYWNWP